MSPGQKRRKAAEAAAEKGIPLGLVRVATLDGVRALLTCFGYTAGYLVSDYCCAEHSPTHPYWHPTTHPTGTPRLRLCHPPPFRPRQLVKQMRSGDVDLRRAVLIGSREAEVAIDSLRAAAK